LLCLIKRFHLVWQYVVAWQEDYRNLRSILGYYLVVLMEKQTTTAFCQGGNSKRALWEITCMPIWTELFLSCQLCDEVLTFRYRGYEWEEN